MAQKFLTIGTRVLGSTLALSVLLSGVHAKEISAFSNAGTTSKHTAVKKVLGDDPSSFKVHHDAHNHIDHQTSKSIVKTFGDQVSLQAEPRNRKDRYGTKKIKAHGNELFHSLYGFAVQASTATRMWL